MLRDALGTGADLLFSWGAPRPRGGAVHGPLCGLQQDLAFTAGALCGEGWWWGAQKNLGSPLQGRQDLR